MGVVLPQSSALPSLDRPLDRLARVLATGHGPYRLSYRDIDDCVDLVSGLAHAPDDGPSPDDVTWTWFDGTEPRGGGHSGPRGLRSLYQGAPQPFSRCHRL